MGHALVSCGPSSCSAACNSTCTYFTCDGVAYVPLTIPSVPFILPPLPGDACGSPGPGTISRIPADLGGVVLSQVPQTVSRPYNTCQPRVANGPACRRWRFPNRANPCAGDWLFNAHFPAPTCQGQEASEGATCTSILECGKADAGSTRSFGPFCANTPAVCHDMPGNRHPHVGCFTKFLSKDWDDDGFWCRYQTESAYLE